MAWTGKRLAPIEGLQKHRMRLFVISTFRLIYSACLEVIKRFQIVLMPIFP